MAARGRGGGRGAYYKAKYGGRNQNNAPVASSGPKPASKNFDMLLQDLQQLDRQQYGAYKRLLHQRYHHTAFTLEFTHIQGDPYAPPSSIRVVKPYSASGLPSTSNSEDRSAIADYCTRLAADYIRAGSWNENVSGSSAGWSGPKGGALNINAPGQEVLARTSCLTDLTAGTIEMRMTVSLPARGRSILGQQAWSVLGDCIPPLVKHCLEMQPAKQHAGLKGHIRVVKDQVALRSQLKTSGLCAFVANGSILPRQSGTAALPMSNETAIAFKSPSALEVTLKGSSGEPITGLGIKCGITVLTGGGFHGKSTLLEAIQAGIYNHIPGDGRELVVTDGTAFKVRAEDGRSVSKTDITPFITTLPGSKDTREFTSSDSSGSTSMAANIQEALEIGCKLLLIDEDTAATNLLLRDERMQSLIDAEPITPFVSKARALHQQQNVSTIIVVGSCGDYLNIADSVIGMEQYCPLDLSGRAREVVKSIPRHINQSSSYGTIPSRSVVMYQGAVGQRKPAARGKDFIKIFTNETNAVKNPAETDVGINVSQLEQLVEPGQLRMIAEYINKFRATDAKDVVHGSQPLKKRMEEVQNALKEGKLDSCCAEPGAMMGNLVEVRGTELAAAINRVAGLAVATQS